MDRLIGAVEANDTEWVRASCDELSRRGAYVPIWAKALRVQATVPDPSVPWKQPAPSSMILGHDSSGKTVARSCFLLLE